MEPITNYKKDYKELRYNKFKMYIDIVFPRDNEQDFIDVAVKLGYNALCFAYPFGRDIVHEKEKIKELEKKYKIKLYAGLCPKPEEIQRAVGKADLIVVKGSFKDRFVLEKTKADIIFNLESHGRDSMHYRSSGLNQVLCRFAKANDICIGFSFSSLLKADSFQKAVLIGRIKQNVKLCRKYKAKTIIASFAEKPFQLRNPSDLISFGITLGMHPSEAKKSLLNALEKITH